MLKIEVVKCETKEVVKKSTGEVFRITEVEAYCHDIDRYPVAIKFGVQRGVQPPAPGFYQLDPSSFYAGKYGALTLKSQLVLRPLAVSPSKAA